MTETEKVKQEQEIQIKKEAINFLQNYLTYLKTEIKLTKEEKEKIKNQIDTL